MKTRIFTVLFACLILIGCGSDRMELFEVDNEIDFTLPGGLNTIETHVFVIRNVPTFLENALTVNGISAEEVKSISATRARLIPILGGVDYDFIDEISIRVLSKTDPSLNKEMFFMDRIPFNQSGELELFSSISELKEIIEEGIIDMEIRVRTRSVTPVDIQNRLIFSYAVFDTE